MPYDKFSGEYFVAANTGNGFVSFFDGIFASLTHLYIIKGGSGTGKSRMMKDIADHAESLGYAVGRCLCSADADSLDGVVIPELGTGILDGTAPHITDPKYPGAVDEIVDVGRFWNKEKLRAHTERIRDIIDRKSTVFGCVYDLLSAAASADRAAVKMQSHAIDRGKMRAAVTRLSRKWPVGSGFENNVRLLDAFTMKGRIRVNSFAKKADVVYTVGGRHGAEPEFLREILRIAREKQQPVFTAPDPLDLTKICELMLPELGIAFVRDAGEKSPEKHINTERFVRPELLRPFKPCLTEAKKRKREALESVDILLSQVRKLHFDLEDIYISAMDFEAKQALTSELIDQIFT